MASNSLPTLKPELKLDLQSSQTDLRSPSLTHFRRGMPIKWLRVVFLVISDSLSITFAWLLASLLGTSIDSPWHISGDQSLLPLILAVGIGITASRGLYKAGGYRRDYIGLLKAIALTEIILLMIAFLYEPTRSISRSTFLLSWIFTMGFTLVGRMTVDLGTRLIRKQGAIRYPVYLISESENRDRHAHLIRQEDCYTLCGFADADSLDRDNRQDTFQTMRELGIVETFVSWNAIKRRLYLCWHFQRAGITLRILPTDWESFFPRSEFHMLGQVPSPTIKAPVIVGSDYWVKRCFDFCCAAVLLLLFFPVYAFLALLIKLDSPGPIFFRQTRIGLHSRKFKVWKFRTMVTNADKLQAELEAQNEMKDGVLFKMKDDPRITRIGKFLRHYSLDELPQLFNILVGQMSFVGPRPLPVRDVERFEERHFIRQEVLPGITGLWQVSGRSNIESFEEAVNLDIRYIADWSLWLDLQIMLKTVQVVIQKQGAY
ncbi:MAG: sugar transferase [Oculatellaceae cyanobacterium Prado106]|nr:sugar transferase [Oculatellaceae cyanobacterium Prado106]